MESRHENINDICSLYLVLSVTGNDQEDKYERTKYKGQRTKYKDLND